MNETFDEFNDLIELMTRARRMPVPDRFVGTLMKRIDAEAKPGPANIAVRFAGYFGKVENSDSSDIRECAACFFLAGFFYLVMGIILTAGFRAIHFSASPAEWITLQPYLTIGAALLLFALGAALMAREKAALKAAFRGTILYIFLVAVNGIFMAPYLNIPHAGLFIAGFMGAGVFMGITLARAVRKSESGVKNANNGNNERSTKDRGRIFAH
ncbi:MAG: hypothetical protein AVO39_09990 [delta proteobacterium MLS_D]|jgi:hypothetical protein|nr:MAG: hypothetical protein AVO39_09990 [delta proteobacterium MLS_D]